MAPARGERRDKPGRGHLWDWRRRGHARARHPLSARRLPGYPVACADRSQTDAPPPRRVAGGWRRSWRGGWGGRGGGGQGGARWGGGGGGGGPAGGANPPPRGG